MGNYLLNEIVSYLSFKDNPEDYFWFIEKKLIFEKLAFFIFKMKIL